MGLGVVSVDFRNSKFVVEPPKTEKYEYLPNEKTIRVHLSYLTKEELRTKEIAIGALSVDFSDYLSEDQKRNIQLVVAGETNMVFRKYGYADGTTKTIRLS